jgi:hypothetical protein
METKVLNSWEEFHIELDKLMRFRDELVAKCHNPDILVFRGQRDSDWHLETTLERETENRDYSMRQYFELIKKARPEIKPAPDSFDWGTLELSEFSDWFEHRNFLWINGLLNYMVFLRHHGFPSPLLDWTSSSLVAAYFAFQNAQKQSVAIFAFLEHTAGAKGTRATEPNIGRIRPDFPLEVRHQRQKSTYTVCTLERDDEIFYSFHENVVLGNRRRKFPQDLLWKFVIPTSEKDKVMKKLELKGITTTTLFASENNREEAETFKKLFKKLAG